MVHVMRNGVCTLMCIPEWVPLDLRISLRSNLIQFILPAGVTQLVEYPFCNRAVEGSNPFASTGDVA